MSEWIEHDGKGMPVGGDTLVTVHLRDGYKTQLLMRAREFDWDNTYETTPLDIMFYRIHEPTPEARGPRT